LELYTDINECKIANLIEAKETELTGRSPVRRRRSALDCSAIGEEEGRGGGTMMIIIIIHNCHRQ